MNRQKQQQKVYEQLSQNYGILHLLLKRQQFSSLKYQQLMYLLMNGRIQISNIVYFKKKMYKNQQPLMRRSFLIKDGVKLKQEIIGKAWRFQRTQKSRQTIQNQSKQKLHKQRVKSQAQLQLNQQQANENNQQNQKSLQQQQKSKKISPKRLSQSLIAKQSRNSNKTRKLELQQLMTLLQSKINNTRNQQQAAEYLKQYHKHFKQLTFLRNKNRVQKQNKLLKDINSNKQQISKQIKQILTQMKQLKQQNSKKLPKQTSYTQKISKVQQLSRLNQIFKFYCKKTNGISHKYFSDIQKSHQKLSLQNFIKFCQDWDLMRIIPIQQIINVFKSHSKKYKQINNLQFAQILTDIHQCQCIRQGKPINNQSISQYIQEYIVADNKMKKIVSGLDIKLQKTQGKSQYRYKPKSHSGKYLQDIKQQIQTRKKTIDFLAGPQNVMKYDRSKSKSRNVETLSNSRHIQTIQSNDNIYNPSLNETSNDTLNSYAFRFKLKNVKNRVKTQGIIKSIQNTRSILGKQKTNHDMGFNRQNIINRQSKHQNQKQLYDITENQNSQRLKLQELLGKSQQLPKKKKQVPFEGFQDLIEQSQQDQYLNKHLLPPIQPKRGLSNQIHY